MFGSARKQSARVLHTSTSDFTWQGIRRDGKDSALLAHLRSARGVDIGQSGAEEEEEVEVEVETLGNARRRHDRQRIADKVMSLSGFPRRTAR